MKQIFLFAFATCIVVACKKQNNSKTDKLPQAKVYQRCPTANDSIKINAHEASYGTWVLGNEGFDGTSGDGTKNLESSCGWLIYNHNAGGTGFVYQAYLPADTAVVFEWTYGSFSSFFVNDKWKGITDTGIKIGDSLTQFKQVYPQSVLFSSNPTLYIFSIELPDGYFQVGATFTSPNGKLNGLGVHIYP